MDKNLPKTGSWLEDAISFDIHSASKSEQVKATTERLFKELEKKHIFREKPIAMQALEIVLLNLLAGLASSQPVRYSRNRNDYRHHKMYRKPHLNYKRLIPEIDMLEGLGYLEQTKGYFFEDRNSRKQTRMYGTPKLVEVFGENELVSNDLIWTPDSSECPEMIIPDDLIYREEQSQIIQLKDEKKFLAKYPESDETMEMRKRLREYDDFIKAQTITIEMPSDAEVNLRFLKALQTTMTRGFVQLKEIETAGSMSSRLILPGQYNKSNSVYPVSYSDTNYSNIVYEPNSKLDISREYKETILNQYYSSSSSKKEYNRNIRTITKTLRDIHGKAEVKALLEKPRLLRECGIEWMVLKSNYQALHRVFNRNSFDFGGRFYGAYHLRLPKRLRRFIKINGQETLELDYSALHIRMLYHLEGIDYKEDPYMVVCDSPEERPLFKLVQLIAINSETEAKAIQAIRDRFRQDHVRCDKTNKGIKSLLDRFYKAHGPIGKYLNSGIGLRLQNIDGIITSEILTGLMEKNVPALPVHDSYIVEKGKKGLLMEVMSDSYEKILRFKPLISPH